MIRSCEFSFDENPEWDTKVIRQHLIISEDQLNILNNIPEWIKEKDDNYYSRITVNEFCVNFQGVQNPSNFLQTNQEVFNCNIELFDKNFDSRENIIQAYKSKFFKSISLFEIDKIITNSPCGNRISRALSLPNLSLFSKEFSASYLYEKSDPSTQLKSSVLNTGKSKTHIENPIMEVVSQLPAVVPQIGKNNENFAIVEKTVLSANQTVQSSDSSSNSCDLLSTLVEIKKLDHIDSIAIKNANVVEIDKLDSDHKNAKSSENKQIIVGTNNNCLGLHENTTKLAEPTDLNLYEKKKIDSSLVKESIVITNSVHDTSGKLRPELEGLNENQKNEVAIVEENGINNDSSLNKDKNFNTHVNDNIQNKFNETSVENLNQLNVVPQLCESKITPVSSDELKSKLADNSHDSKMDAEIALKTACQGAGDGQIVTSQNHPLKRKSESKARSTKRSKSSREKQGCVERSIKKAGEIYYSAEDTKIMFDLLKLLL